MLTAVLYLVPSLITDHVMVVTLKCASLGYGEQHQHESQMKSTRSQNPRNVTHNLFSMNPIRIRIFDFSTAVEYMTSAAYI